MSVRAVSVATAVALVTGMAGVAVADASTGHLTGDGRGTWKVQPGNPDTGTQRAITGRGHFSIGNATIRGSVTSPGFIANGACSVSISLKTATGSIGVVGQTKRTSSSYPTCLGPFRFRFHTVKASGVLTGLSYTGVGRFNLKTASSSATDKGTFTLALSRS
jgi:hypothetical protein